MMIGSLRFCVFGRYIIESCEYILILALVRQIGLRSSLEAQTHKELRSPMMTTPEAWVK